MKKSSLLIAVLLLLFLNLSAQKNPIKFGKIDIEDLEMDFYFLDSSAPAVVLCDYGRTYFVLDEERGFRMKFERIRRVKILKKEGYKYASMEIPYYNKDNTYEAVNYIAANTYNLVGGKIHKTKLYTLDIYDEKVSKYWDKKKFTMPNVNVGSVVEFQYEITSDFFSNFRDWYFQEDIPIIWSEYKVEIPEYFQYQHFFKGYEPLVINEKKEKSQRFLYKETSQIRQPGLNNKNERSSSSLSTFEFDVTHYKWAAKDVPVFTYEPYITTKENYLTKIYLELRRYSPPRGMHYSFTDTWESLNKHLILHEDFGSRLKYTSFLKDISSNIVTTFPDSLERMIAVFDTVKNRVAWDEYLGRYANKSLKSTYEQQVGNVAEINLLLTALLRESGLNATPVILSTRDNGEVNPDYPSLEKFNYVVSLVIFGDSYYLLDATNKNNSYLFLPYHCLNGNGRIINEDFTNWIPLTSKKSDNSTISLELKIDDNYNLVGKYSSSLKDYASFRFRNEYSQENNEDLFMEDYRYKYPNMNIDSIEIINIDSSYLPIKHKMSVTINNSITNTGDLIYFNPILFNRMERNIFKIENRKYPVDFAIPINQTYILNVAFPEGYALDDKPENISMSLPNNAGRFIYSITQIGNNVQVMTRFMINKTFFYQNEYNDLKAFYDEIVKKQSEQILLKKI